MTRTSTQPLLGSSTELDIDGSWVPPGTPWYDRKAARQPVRLLSVQDCVFVTEAVKYNRSLDTLWCDGVVFCVRKCGFQDDVRACVAASTTTRAATTWQRRAGSCSRATQRFAR